MLLQPAIIDQQAAAKSSWHRLIVLGNAAQLHAAHNPPPMAMDNHISAQ
jgi:hypothetical protein